MACSLCFVVHFHGGAGIVAKKGTRYPHTHNGDDATVDRPHRGSDRVLVYGGGDLPVAHLRRLLQKNARTGDEVATQPSQGCFGRVSRSTLFECAR